MLGEKERAREQAKKGDEFEICSDFLACTATHINDLRIIFYANKVDKQ